MKTLQCEHLIIGAGISGLSTAYKLSEEYGRSVIILEKKSFYWWAMQNY